MKFCCFFFFHSLQIEIRITAASWPTTENWTSNFQLLVSFEMCEISNNMRSVIFNFSLSRIDNSHRNKKWKFVRFQWKWKWLNRMHTHTLRVNIPKWFMQIILCNADRAINNIWSELILFMLFFLLSLTLVFLCCFSVHDFDTHTKNTR